MVKISCLVVSASKMFQLKNTEELKNFIESLQPDLVNDDIEHLHTSCIKLFADESRGPVERAEIAIPP